MIIQQILSFNHIKSHRGDFFFKKLFWRHFEILFKIRMKRSSVAFGGDFLWWTHWKWMSSSGGRCKLFKWWMAAAWLHLNPTDKWRRVRQACSIEANRFESQNFFFGNKKVPAVAIATGPPPQVFPPNFLSDGARLRLKKKSDAVLAAITSTSVSYQTVR